MTLQIISPTVPRLAENDSTIALLVSCRKESDSSDQVTRIYPYGGGIGDGKLTIAEATKSAAGYAPLLAVVIDTAAGFVRVNTGGSEPSPRVDRSVGFKDIQPLTADERERERAANALLDAAVVWLYRHSTAITTYDLTAANIVKGSVKPGDTVHVEYREYVGGTQIWAVDSDLIVLEVQDEVGGSAAGLTRLVVSTVAAWPISDAELLAREIKNSRALGSRPQAVGMSNIHLQDFVTRQSGLITGNGGIVYGGADAASVSGGGGAGLVAHQMVGPYHYSTDLTVGTFIRAESSGSFAWATIGEGDVPATIARANANMIAGAGLTGGGTLSTDRTFAVGAGNGLSVAADSVAAVAGAGVTVTSTGIALTAPGTLTVATTNASAGNHTHAITASANPGAAASLLKTGSSGTIQLEGLGVGVAASTGNIILQNEIKNDDYAIDSDGFRLTGIGEGFFRYLYASELHAKSFIADLEQALAGGQMICKSVAPLAAAFTLPDAAAAANFTVQEFQGFGGFRVFVDGDLVRFRNFSRGQSSLDITDAWGTVAYVSRDSAAQTQTWAFTRSAAAGGLAGYLSPNLLTNGGFETNGAGGDDIFGTWIETKSDGAVTKETVAAQIHGGVQGTSVTDGASHDSRIEQIVTVTASTLYRFSFWTRGLSGNAGRYSIYDLTHSAYIQAIVTTGVTGNTFAQVSNSFTTPAGCVSIVVSFYAAATAGAIAYFDDASLVKVGAGGEVIPKGALVLDYGTSGNGYIESVAQSGAMAQGVPYLSMKTWDTHPQSTSAGQGLIERVHLGNMNGSYGKTADVFGIGIGEYAASTGNFLRYDSSGGFKLQAGGGAVSLDPNGIGISASASTFSERASYRMLSGSTTLATLYTLPGSETDTYLRTEILAGIDAGVGVIAQAPSTNRAWVSMYAARGAEGFQSFVGLLARNSSAEQGIHLTGGGVILGGGGLGTPGPDGTLTLYNGRIYLSSGTGSTGYLCMSSGRIAWYDGTNYNLLY